MASNRNIERARIWLEHDPEDCYWSLSGWCKEDQQGMVDELAEFIDAIEGTAGNANIRANLSEAIECITDNMDCDGTEWQGRNGVFQSVSRWIEHWNSISSAAPPESRYLTVDQVSEAYNLFSRGGWGTVMMRLNEFLGGSK